MRISDANAAIRVARWAHAHRDQLTPELREDIPHLAEAAGKKLMAGLNSRELDELRSDATTCRGVREVHLPEETR